MALVVLRVDAVVLRALVQQRVDEGVVAQAREAHIVPARVKAHALAVNGRRYPEVNADRTGRGQFHPGLIAVALELVLRRALCRAAVVGLRLEGTYFSWASMKMDAKT